MSDARRQRWWIAYPLCLVLLVLTDTAVASWDPHPARLPEFFSAAYLQRQISDLRGRDPAIVVTGDSVVWGYRVDESSTAVAALRRELPGYKVVNFAYEGGSTTNTEMLIRYILAGGIRPKLVLFNANMKEMNPADSAYRRLHPALEEIAQPLLGSEDRRELEFSAVQTLEGRLDRFMAAHWTLYAHRTDIKEALFGKDDLTSRLLAEVQRWTGTAARLEAAHRPSAERFMGTYDVTPLDDSNVAFHRLRKTLQELQRARVPAVVFVSPTNHGLLHQYVDNPDYAANVRAVAGLCKRYGALVVNLDGAFAANEFLDNDHLTEAGNAGLARRLLPEIRSALLR